MELTRSRIVETVASQLLQHPVAPEDSELWEKRARQYLRSCRKLWADSSDCRQLLGKYEAFVQAVLKAVCSEQDDGDGRLDSVTMAIALKILRLPASESQALVQADVVDRLLTLLCRAPISDAANTHAWRRLVGLLPVPLGAAYLRSLTGRVKFSCTSQDADTQLMLLKSVAMLWHHCGHAGLAMVVEEIAGLGPACRQTSFDLLEYFYENASYCDVATIRLASACIETMDGVPLSRGGAIPIHLSYEGLAQTWLGHLQKVIGEACKDESVKTECSATFLQKVGDHLYERLHHALVAWLKTPQQTAEAQMLRNACASPLFFGQARLNALIDHLLIELDGQAKRAEWHLAYTQIAQFLCGLFSKEDRRRIRVEKMYGYYVLRRTDTGRDYYRSHIEILLRLMHGQAQTTEGRLRLRRDVEQLLSEDTLESQNASPDAVPSELDGHVRNNAKVCREVIGLL